MMTANVRVSLRVLTMLLTLGCDEPSPRLADPDAAKRADAQLACEAESKLGAPTDLDTRVREIRTWLDAHVRHPDIRRITLERKRVLGFSVDSWARRSCSLVGSVYMVDLPHAKTAATLERMPRLSISAVGMTLDGNWVGYRPAPAEIQRVDPSQPVPALQEAMTRLPRVPLDVAASAHLDVQFVLRVLASIERAGLPSTVTLAARGPEGVVGIPVSLVHAPVRQGSGLALIVAIGTKEVRVLRAGATVVDDEVLIDTYRSVSLTDLTRYVSRARRKYRRGGPIAVTLRVDGEMRLGDLVHALDALRFGLGEVTVFLSTERPTFD